MRNIDKAIILMIGRAFSSLTIIIISIILARSLSKYDYGTYVQITMIIQLIGVVLSFGLPSSLTYFLPKIVNKRTVILRTYIILIIIGAAGFSILFYSKEYISILLNNERLNDYMFYAGVGTLFYLASMVTRPILLQNKESMLLAKIEIFRSALFLCSMSVSVAVSSKISHAILIYIACIIVDFVFSLVIVIREVLAHTGKYSEKKIPLSGQIKYSLPLGMTVLCWYSGRELDKYMISHYMTPDELAIYSRGAIELPLVHLLASTISQLKLPDWVTQWDNGSKASLIAGWHNTITKSALVVFPSFILLELVGSDFITLLYSEKYLQSVNIFYLYLLLLPLQITSYTAIVESTGKNHFILVGYVVQLLASITLSGLSIDYFGWYGPALISVVGMYTFTAYALIVISRIFDIEFNKVFPWKKLYKILLVSILSCALPFLIKILTNEFFAKIFVQKEFFHASNIILQSFVFLLCYIYLAIKYSIAEEEDIDTISRWLLIYKIKKILNRIV